jgi:hypothetical protein
MGKGGGRILGEATILPLPLWVHQVNSAPRCLGHAGGMTDLMQEGAP